MIKVTNNHSKRVAYMAVCTAEKMGIQGQSLQDLAECALLHDNTVAQYIQEELQNDSLRNGVTKLGRHCIIGEKILKNIPFHMIDNETLDTMLWKKVPRIKLELNFAQIKAIADLFAHIVDYKSPFTSNHSMGVEEGAEKISRFMGFDEDICQKMYIARALHDIGKVAIGNGILEKPEKLTDEEFKTMKHHAVYTYYILSGIDDFEEIRDWAALHHEKLNG